VRAQIEPYLSLRGRQRGRHGQQPGLDRAAVGHRPAARHRQALPGQPDDRQGGGQAALNSDAGISYTEFSYQILQGLDFLELFRRHGCVLQTAAATSGAT
jgi:hypothetical protein